MREIVLINITGEDRPGLTAAITGVLASNGVNILDIGQAAIHGVLSLGFLVEIPQAELVSAVLKDLQPLIAKEGLQLRFDPISEEHYQRWVHEQSQTRHVVTLMSRQVTAHELQRVTSVISQHGLNIEQTDRLSGRVPLDASTESSKSCIELRVCGEPVDVDALRADFFNLAQELGVDIALQEDTLFRRNRRLAVFDMDSTLIEAEVIDELAKAAGVGDQVAAITERAMAGELDFKASFKELMALLKGLDVGVLDAITYFAKQVQARLGIDYVFANELEVVDGKVTGVAVEPIVDAQRKADLLRELAQKEGLSLEQTIAVGDGANDLPMLAIAGLGVAFRAKPLVKKSAKHAISTLGLDGVLYLLGQRDRNSQG